MIVSVNVPVAADAVVAMVKVELLPDRIDVGLNVPAAPLGRPLTDSPTVWALPEVIAVLTV